MYKQMAYVHMYISGDAAEVVMQALKWMHCQLKN